MTATESTNQNSNSNSDNTTTADIPESNLIVRGDVFLTVFDDGLKVKARREVRNLVVNAGVAYIVSRMVDSTKSVMTHLGVGSSGDDTDPELKTDLVSLIGSRQSLYSTTITGTNDEKIVYLATFAAGEATGAIEEAGIFNSATGGVGDMLCRTVFPVVNKGAEDTMVISWILTITAV